MAKEIITRLIDDITNQAVEDGEGESIQFGVNGVAYEIDLNDKNAAKFHETMKFYIDHSSRVEVHSSAPAHAPQRRAASKSVKSDPQQLAAMRTWLREQGHAVSDRGRIAQSLQDIYNTANN
jgi:hypothetical protein